MHETSKPNDLLDFRYGEYAELCGVLSKYVKTKDQILMVSSTDIASSILKLRG